MRFIDFKLNSIITLDKNTKVKVLHYNNVCINYIYNIDSECRINDHSTKNHNLLRCVDPLRKDHTNVVFERIE